MLNFGTIPNTSGEFPLVVARDASGPYELGGTPLLASWVSQVWAWQQGVVNQSGETPDGDNTADQFLSCLDALMAALLHDHGEDYASLAHNHDGVLAELGHDHSSFYSTLAHNHAALYSSLSHTHIEAFQNVSHNGTINCDESKQPHYVTAGIIATSNPTVVNIESDVCGIDGLILTIVKQSANSNSLVINSPSGFEFYPGGGTQRITTTSYGVLSYVVDIANGALWETGGV